MLGAASDAAVHAALRAVSQFTEKNYLEILPEYQRRFYKEGKKMSKSKYPVRMPTGNVIGPAVDMTYEDRWKVAVNAWRNTFFYSVDHLGKEIGWERASEVLGQTFMESYPAAHFRLKKLFKIEGNTPADIVKVHAVELKVEGFDYDVTEANETRSVVVMTLCPWYQDMKDRHKEALENVDLERLLCGPGCAWGYQEFVKALDPRLVACWTKWVHKGDGVCEFVVEYEEE